MTRALRFVVRNWPLKLAAVILASLLYGGLILSQSSRPFEGSVSIEPVGQSSSVIILSDLGAVTRIRYFAPEDLGLRLDSSAFHATIDLSNADPSAGTVSMAVTVVAIDPRIQVLEFEPRRINVTLDRVISRQVAVRAVLGPAPAGLDLGTPVLSDVTAMLRGPASFLARVTEAQARVQIDASGIDINRVVDLLPVDALGEPVNLVDVEPTTVRVRVPVFTNRQTKTVPIHPVVTGTPAPGFEVAAVSVAPLVVGVEGDANDLSGLAVADTAPISVSGASATVTSIVGLALPDGVQAVGDTPVTVTISLRPVTATRTFQAGLLVVGARSDRTYVLSTDRVLVTIGGSVADLDRLSGSSLTLTLDVTGLDVGSHEVKVGTNLTTGLALVGAAPATVTVTIDLGAGPASPSPTP
jgi:YbbR domain-containing protein